MPAATGARSLIARSPNLSGGGPGDDERVRVLGTGRAQRPDVGAGQRRDEALVRRLRVRRQRGRQRRRGTGPPSPRTRGSARPGPGAARVRRAHADPGRTPRRTSMPCDLERLAVELGQQLALGEVERPDRDGRVAERGLGPLMARADRTAVNRTTNENKQHARTPLTRRRIQLSPPRPSACTLGPMLRGLGRGGGSTVERARHTETAPVWVRRREDVIAAAIGLVVLVLGMLAVRNGTVTSPEESAFRRGERPPGRAVPGDLAVAAAGHARARAGRRGRRC